MKNNLINLVYEELIVRGYETVIVEIKENNRVFPELLLYPENMPAASGISGELLEHLHRPGMQVNELADQVLALTEDKMLQLPDVEILKDKLQIPAHARLAVCSTDWNRELLEELPHKNVAGTDLSVFVKVYCNSNVSMRVTHTFLKHSGLNEKALFDSARENSEKEYTVVLLSELLQKKMGLETAPFTERPAAVVTNRAHREGAAAITDSGTLTKAAQILGTDRVYILPSSIHELLLFDAKDWNPQELIQMVQRVNSDMVRPRDRLSDGMYLFAEGQLQRIRPQSGYVQAAGK